jgi:nicotinamide-nucleotide amidase
VIFGVDEQSMEVVVLDQLKALGLTLAVAESLTGGLMAARLTEMDPDMITFRGGTVGNAKGKTGGNKSPSSLSSASTPSSSGADLAAEAAEEVRQTFATDAGLAVTAPQPGEDHPPGTVFMHLALANTHHTGTVALPGDRARFRNYAVINVLNFVRKALTQR